MKPGQARQVNPRLEPGRVEEKIGEGKTQCDPARPGQDSVANSLTFVFLLKRRRFDCFKKRTNPADLVKTRNPGFGLDRVLKLWIIDC